MRAKGVCTVLCGNGQESHHLAMFNSATDLLYGLCIVFSPWIRSTTEVLWCGFMLFREGLVDLRLTSSVISESEAIGM